MMTREEKQQMREDGLSSVRRKDFRKASNKGKGLSTSLDDYIRFLSSIPDAAVSSSTPCVKTKNNPTVFKL